MKYFIFLLFICLYQFGSAKSDPPIPQIEIEARIIEAKQDFTKELGIEFILAPVISNFTNLDNENKAVVPGVGIYAGVTAHVKPVLSVFGHFNINQFGNGSKFEDGYNRTRFTSAGADAGIKLHVKPQAKVDGQILMGIKFGGITGGVNKYKQGGDKDKVRFDLNSENKAFAGIMAGGLVTIRNDVVDIGTGVIVIGGLTQLNNNIENQPRSVPWLVELPVVFNFFNKPKHRERDDILIFLTPKIIENNEP